MKQQKGILILEDNPLLLYQLQEKCLEHGYSVYDCDGIYRASETWESHKDSINAIIADINMDPRGLTKEEIRMSRNGKFSGWLWVNNYIINAGFPPANVIILSEYNDDLFTYISNSVPAHKNNYMAIKKRKQLIDKVDPSWATGRALDLLQKLLK